MKRIAYLGAGTWGFSLTSLLAQKGHEVALWTRSGEAAAELQKTRQHPKLPGYLAPESVRFTSDLAEALQSADVIIESVTSSGIRPVFRQVLQFGPIRIPVILTSKGIEQGTGQLLPEVVAELIGVKKSILIGCLSGPSLADEVLRHMPTSVVSSAYDPGLMQLISELFSTPTFRIYPNADVRGVCFGGAMKNIIAIACGIADGLGYGDNAKAALMTRGLHEIRKLGEVLNCKSETINGLSGMGDLCATCLSLHSRNYRFGRLIAEGLSPEAARREIGMAVEGVYSCVSARELAQRFQLPVPITEAAYSIIYEGMPPKEAVLSLLQRSIKEERL